MANFHWVGATGNSVSKYDWNQTSNWWVKETSPTGSYDPSYPASAFSRATRLPIAGDMVYIGTELHCLSPLLYGGYSGDAQTHNGGNWGVGLTTGVTAGGIGFTYLTDIAPSDDSVSLSYSLLAGLTANPGKLFSPASYGSDTELADYLLNVNPHSGLIGATSAAVYGETSSRYPFPYLGGGLTGQIWSWATNQHKQSYRAFIGLGGTGATSYAAANAWVGGGITGAYFGDIISSGGVGDRIAFGALRVRVGAKGMIISSGVPSTTAKSKAFEQKLVNMFVACDKGGAGSSSPTAISSKITIDQPYKLGHSYVFYGQDITYGPYITVGERKGNGLIESIGVKGDCQVQVHGITAAFGIFDLHASTRIGQTSRFGGITIEQRPWGVSTEPARVRYNSWPLVMEGSITGGCIPAIYGGVTGSISVPAQNKLQLNDYSLVLQATDGISGAYANPYPPSIVLGTVGLTSAVCTIPTVQADSPASQKPYSSPNDKVWNLHLAGSSRIGQVTLNGGLLMVSPYGTPGMEVQVGNCDMRNNAILDFTTNGNIDSVYFGSLTGSNVTNYRLIGGINALDETCKVYSSAGLRFINTKLLGQNLFDGRAGKFSGSAVFANSINDKNDLASFAETPTKFGTENAL